MFDPSKLNIWDWDDKNQEDSVIFNDNKSKLNNQEEEKSNSNVENIEKEESHINETEKENNEVVEEIIEEKKSEIEDNTKNNIIYDININSISDILKYLIYKNYDFFILVPDDEKVTISFRKDRIEKEVKYIKFPIYNNILLKAKAITKLKIEDTSNDQEGSWNIKLDWIEYKTVSKTSPSNFWERLFLKITKTETKKVQKKVKKMSIGKILWLMWALIVTLLLIWWAILWFILIDSNSVEDLIFLKKFWIDLWDIKDFIKLLIWIIFWILIFIEIILLSIFSFKGILTKSIHKKKKTASIILSWFLFFVLLATAILWASLYKKADWLEWQWYWEIMLYDNENYLFTWNENNSKIDIKNESIIWPISIRIDIKEFIKKFIADEWNEIQSITWILWDEEREWKAKEYVEIKKFDEIWKFDLKLKIDYYNIKWEKSEKIHDIWILNIKHKIDIQKTMRDDKFFDLRLSAESIKNTAIDKWKIEWYHWIKDEFWDFQWLYYDKDTMSEKQSKKISYILKDSYEYIPTKAIEKETFIWIKMDPESDKFSKILIFKPEKNNFINWKIIDKVDVENDKLYTFYVNDIVTEAWIWYITDFEWEIEWTPYSKPWDSLDQEAASKITHEFKKYWSKTIKVTLFTWWKNPTKKILTKTINLKWKVLLNNKLIIRDRGIEINDVIYKKDTNEYTLKKLWIPTILEFDAQDIEANSSNSTNSIYLDTVEWDFDWDWKKDKVWKKVEYPIEIEGNYNVTAKYIFKYNNKKIDKTLPPLTETIYIRTLKKECLLSLDIKPKSDYAPTKVTFDWSRSEVKWKDIIKFVYNYWDNTWNDEIWAKNTAHLYEKHWTYKVTLTAITRDWTKCIIQKHLELLPLPQVAKIWASMNISNKNEYIDFDSRESSWDIKETFWDFWDWEISTERNPSHFYKKAWKYKVELSITYKNNNIQTNDIEVIITD